MGKKIAIVGLDPGNNFGIAILYLDGSFVTALFKNPKDVDIINYIEKLCIPIIFTTDVKKIPPIVKKIANFFGTEVYSTGDIKKVEKFAKTKNFNLSDHERMALYSALKYFESYGERIKKIISKFEEYKVYFIRNMIRGFMPQFPSELKKEFYEYSGSKRETVIEREIKYVDVIVVEREVKREYEVSETILQFIILLKENKIPIMEVNSKNVKEWFEKYGEIVRGFPIYIKSEEILKKSTNFLEKFEIPFVIVDRNISIYKEDNILREGIDIKLRKFGRLFYLEEEEFRGYVAKIIKKKLESSGKDFFYSF